MTGRGGGVSGRGTASQARMTAAALAGYLAGTLPSADIAARLAKGGQVNLREAGSGNPGALNALNELGKGWGAAVLVADMGKGVAGAFAGRVIAGDVGAYVAATTSIAGHIAPVWSRFRGGKGVATSAGACLAVFPAYFPFDAGVAALAAIKTGAAEKSVWVSAVCWVTASVVWWRRRLPNAWGPEASGWLVVFSTAGAGMIVSKFAAARHRQGQPPFEKPDEGQPAKDSNEPPGGQQDEDAAEPAK